MQCEQSKFCVQCWNNDEPICGMEITFTKTRRGELSLKNHFFPYDVFIVIAYHLLFLTL